MGYIEAILLGILQGFTEFLPVSSSGHLEIFSHILGVNTQENLSFSIVAHAGTVLSTIVVFWREILRLICGLFKFKLNEETIFVSKIAISFIPIIIVGLTLKDQLEALFGGNLLIVGVMLLVTAVALWTTTRLERRRHEEKQLTYWRAFVIGIAQSLAVLPGLSRSGSTISTGLILGLARQEAARFSFLMVLVPIIGINFLEIIGGGFASSALPPSILVVGFLSSFICGTLACNWMLRIVNQGKLIWFALYCLLMGAATIVFSVLGL